MCKTDFMILTGMVLILLDLFSREQITIIIIIKKGWQCKAVRERFTPYQSEDPSPAIPTQDERRKGKTVGDIDGASSKANQKQANRRYWPSS